MKKIVLIALLANTFLSYSQSTIQTINSGSLITANSSVSIGEIVINPVNQNQSSSGLIGILSQLNQQLEVPQFELSETIVVYPNPTEASILFKSTNSLASQKVTVYTTNGQLVAEKTIQSDNSVDLSNLSSGIYLIQLTSDKAKSFKIIKH
jgi:Secretion system C-terminal sorting domain